MFKVQGCRKQSIRFQSLGVRIPVSGFRGLGFNGSGCRSVTIGFNQVSGFRG